MQRRLRWTQVDEQEHSATPETPASGETAPVTGPAPAAEPTALTGSAAGSGRERRGEGVRDVITSRGAGWAVAAAMAGAVVGLSVAMAMSSSPTVVVQPDSAAGLRGIQARAARATVPGALRAVPPGGRVLAQAPARLRMQAPARVRIQVPAGGSVQTPARLRIRVPATGARQTPAQLRLLAPVPRPAGTVIPLPRAAQVIPGRQVVAGVVAPRAVRLRVRPGQVRVRLLAPVPGPAGTVVPLPRAAQVIPGRQVVAGVVAPRAVRLRVRPGQVRVRVRVPMNGRLQVLPGSPAFGPLRVVAPGSRPAALVPAPPTRLRIVFRNGTPVPARPVIPASQPGQTRLRIQVPARARIQLPARARISKALPAPPNW